MFGRNKAKNERMDELLAKERMLEIVRDVVRGGQGLTEQDYADYGEKQSFSRTGISQGNSSYNDEIAEEIHKIPRHPNPRRVQTFEVDMAPMEKSGKVEGMPATLAQKIRMQRFEKWTRRQCKRKCVICPQCIDDLRKIVAGE